MAAVRNLGMMDDKPDLGAALGHKEGNSLSSKWRQDIWKPI